MNNFKENFRSDGTRVACYYCNDMIEGNFINLAEHIVKKHPDQMEKKRI